MAKAVRTVFDEWHVLNDNTPVFFEGSPRLELWLQSHAPAQTA